MKPNMRVCMCMHESIGTLGRPLSWTPSKPPGIFVSVPAVNYYCGKCPEALGGKSFFNTFNF